MRNAHDPNLVELPAIPAPERDAFDPSVIFDRSNRRKALELFDAFCDDGWWSVRDRLLELLLEDDSEEASDFVKFCEEQHNEGAI